MSILGNPSIHGWAALNVNIITAVSHGIQIVKLPLGT